MGELEKGKTWAMWGWVRREKAVAGLFVALTLVVGILIGTIVSGHTSRDKRVQVDNLDVDLIRSRLLA